MYLKINKEQNILIVGLNGELDHHSAEEVRNKIDDRLDRDKIKTLILDFSGVTFMDSSGIGVVIGRYKKMSMRDGSLLIASINNNVKKVFELSGLFKIITAFDTVEEAFNNI
ncbi:anti-sigma F factor antagonist [Clostridium polynesiense]|uniref:anti-sigma F factor antagonist n=1 Tax=Clostridium polynesiense TaxID=1325933 RepID=UPI00058D1729|nr:anti-sigma F factor antagonist [Clostridium polynesiense]